MNRGLARMDAAVDDDSVDSGSQGDLRVLVGSRSGSISEQHRASHTGGPSATEGPDAGGHSMALCSVAALPYHVYLELVSHLNAPSANHNDWKTLAARLGLSTSEILSYDEEGLRAASVLRYMSDKDLPLVVLTGHLRSMERHDALQVLIENGLYVSVSPRLARKLFSQAPLLGSIRSLSIGDAASPGTRRALLKMHEQRSMCEPPSEENVPEASMLSLQMRSKEILLSSIKRRAVFFSVSQYGLPELKLLQPKEDVAALAQAFRANGWEVFVHEDYAREEFRLALSELKQKCKNSIIFFYFSGLAVQMNGQNYLLPADIATTASPATVVYRSVSLEQVLLHLEPALMKLIVLDACRPVPRWPSAAGLAAFCAPSRSCCILPCQPGQTVPHVPGSVGSLSTFATSLLNQLSAIDTPLHMVVERVKQMSHTVRPYSCMPFAISRSRCLLPLALHSSTTHGLRSVLSAGEELQVHGLFLANYANIRASADQHGVVHSLERAFDDRNWTLDVHADCSGAEMTAVICSYITARARDPSDKTVAMVMFSGFAAKDPSSSNMYMIGTDMTKAENLEDVIWQRNSPLVSVNWLLDLISENVLGPKVFVLDGVWQCPLLPPSSHAPSVSSVDMPSAGLAAIGVPSTDGQSDAPRLCADLAQALRAQPSSTLNATFKSLPSCLVKSSLFYM